MSERKKIARAGQPAPRARRTRTNYGRSSEIFPYAVRHSPFTVRTSCYGKVRTRVLAGRSQAQVTSSFSNVPPVHHGKLMWNEFFLNTRSE
jgi:hypothetical protein